MAGAFDPLRQWSADLARAAFWVGLRPVVRPGHPRSLAWTAAALGEARGRLRGSALAEDEVRRCFPGVAEPARVVREGAREAVRSHLEELLLDRLTAVTVAMAMAMDGRGHLDAAVARGRGVVLAYPHAGSVMLMIARLSLSGYDYAQVALRGFAPPERRVTADFEPTRLNRAVRRVRDAAEDALPAQFLPVEAGARGLFRVLERGGVLGLALDGRGGRRFVDTRWLGRPARISPGPYRLAAKTGAAVVPALCRRGPDGRAVLWLGEPLTGGADVLREATLAAVGRELSGAPHLYAPWLAHCRVRAAADDDPLFTDYPAAPG